MESVTHYLGGFFIPGMIVLLAVGMLLTIKYIASRYKRIPPNAVGVFYGRRYKGADGQTVGFMVVSGGGRVQRPMVEDCQMMNTSAFQVPIEENEVPNMDNVKITAKGFATCKISTKPDALNRACQSFLGKSEAEIKEFVGKNLKGHLRSIIGKLGISELLRDRDSFNKMVVSESKPELEQLGIELLSLVVSDISDELGYIDALGQQAVAETTTNAAVKVAEANRTRDISVSNAARESALNAADNDAKIAEAEKQRDVKKAQYKAETDTEKAKADTALAIATAAQQQTLQVAEAARDAAAKEAQLKVQEKAALLKTKELEATMIATAKAERDKTVIDAEATKQRQIIEAEATVATLTKIAEAKRQQQTLEGEGEAAKQQAILVAQAVGAAAMKKQALIAEAEGTKQLAEALAQMTESARFILILDKLPGLMDKGGDALAKVASAIFSSVAAPFGSIDKVEIVDIGGSGKGLEQLSSIVPNVVFKFLAQAKAMGLDVSSLCSLVGIDASKAFEMLGGASPEVPPAPAAPKVEPKTK